MSTTNINLDSTSLTQERDSKSHPRREVLELPCSAGANAPGHRKHGLAVQRFAFNGDGVRTKRDLLGRNRELASLIEEKSQILAMAAHDLRNPVSNILILTELLQEEAGNGLTEEQKELLQAIHSSGEYTQRLLDSVFDLSVMESDSFRLSFELRDPQEILERVVSFNRAFAKARNIQIALQAGRPGPRINLDPVKIEQVFNTLVSNAIKYSQAGARVEVRITTERDAVHISVEDNGPGIPLQDLETLFTPFQKTQARATQPGSGLGLAIAKRIVGRHGGQIWAESAVGLGSTFHLRLPILDVSIVPEGLAGIA